VDAAGFDRFLGANGLVQAYVELMV
jgi:hypothetical protein